MKVRDISAFLEGLSPLNYQEDYDNCGLLTGDAEMEVTKTLLTLDVTTGVVKEAISLGCNFIVAHHPLIFRGLKKIVPGIPEHDALLMAIRKEIAIYAIHTNLDNSLDGLNTFVLNKLGVMNPGIIRPLPGKLRKLVTFCPLDHADRVREALFLNGAGTIGLYDKCSFNLSGEGTFRASPAASPFVGKVNELHFEPELRIEVIYPQYMEKGVVAALLEAHPYQEVAYDLYPLANHLPSAGAGAIGTLDKKAPAGEFLHFLKNQLNIPQIRFSGSINHEIHKVAICTGSGGFLISDALKAGADLFITADLKYHDFFPGRQSMVLADIGHYESEQWVKEWLFAKLVEKFPTFAFPISTVNTNPVNYL
jgi:dinuclear metal center YbgI/SA1388 family protein